MNCQHYVSACPVFRARSERLKVIQNGLHFRGTVQGIVGLGAKCLVTFWHGYLFVN